MHNSFGMVYATLVQYFCDIPASDAVTFLGIPISGKIFIYSIALQVSTGTNNIEFPQLCCVARVNVNKKNQITEDCKFSL